MKKSIIKSKDNKEKIPIFTMHVTKGHFPYFPQMTPLQGRHPCYIQLRVKEAGVLCGRIHLGVGVGEQGSLERTELKTQEGLRVEKSQRLD